MNDEGMNLQFENSLSSMIPTIEDVKTPSQTPIMIHDETSVETLAETCTKT